MTGHRLLLMFIIKLCPTFLVPIGRLLTVGCAKSHCQRGGRLLGRQKERFWHHGEHVIENSNTTMIYGKILEIYRKYMAKICPKWAHNGPFELSAGHREHRERVRSLNLRQFEPPKTFPGLKNVKNVSKKLGDPVS